MRTAISVVRNFALAMVGCVAMIAGDANAQGAVQRFVTQGRAKTVGPYFIAGYALAMLMNVFFPHHLATLIMRRYAPGTATALLLNLPVTVLLLYQGVQQSYIRLSTFMWAGPLVVAAILGTIPLSFAIGRAIGVYKRRITRPSARL